LVVVKAILYKRTIALGTRIDFRKDLRRSEPRGDGDGSGWRKKAVQTGGRIHNNTEKNAERDLLCVQPTDPDLHARQARQSITQSFIHSFNQSIVIFCLLNNTSMHIYINTL